MRFITLCVADSLVEVRDCQSNSYKITSIVLDLESISPKSKDTDYWPLWVYKMDRDGVSYEALLANLSRTVSQVQIDVEFSIHDDVKFVVRSAKSGVVYLNGYEVKDR